jgi:hypothetical protein
MRTIPRLRSAIMVKSRQEQLRKQQKALRTSLGSSDRLSLVQSLVRGISFVYSEVGLWFCFRGQSHSMCKYYGHIYNKYDSLMDFPLCNDCGERIRDVSELRTAAVRSEALG